MVNAVEEISKITFNERLDQQQAIDQISRILVSSKEPSPSITTALINHFISNPPPCNKMIYKRIGSCLSIARYRVNNQTLGISTLAKTLIEDPVRNEAWIKNVCHFIPRALAWLAWLAPGEIVKLVKKHPEYRLKMFKIHVKSLTFLDKTSDPVLNSYGRQQVNGTLQTIKSLVGQQKKLGFLLSNDELTCFERMSTLAMSPVSRDWATAVRRAQLAKYLAKPKPSVSKLKGSF